MCFNPRPNVTLLCGAPLYFVNTVVTGPCTVPESEHCSFVISHFEVLHSSVWRLDSFKGYKTLPDGSYRKQLCICIVPNYVFHIVVIEIGCVFFRIAFYDVIMTSLWHLYFRFNWHWCDIATNGARDVTREKIGHQIKNYSSDVAKSRFKVWNWARCIWAMACY